MVHVTAETRVVLEPGFTTNLGISEGKPHRTQYQYTLSIAEEGSRAQHLKEWHSQRTQHKLIRTKWVQDEG